jgi:Putative amidase domain
MPTKRRRAAAVLVPMVAATLLGGAAHASAEPGLSTTQAQDLIGRYLSERAFRVTQAANSRAGQTLAVVPATDTMRRQLDQEAQELDGVRGRTSHTAFGGYLKAEVDVTVGNVAGDAANARVDATERTNLYFGRDNPKGPQFEGYRIEHEFAFTNQNGVWSLASATPILEGGGPPPAPQFGAMTAKRVRSADGPAHLQGKLPTAGTITALAAGAQAPANVPDKLSRPADVAPNYDYQAMYNYAAAHWNNYNNIEYTRYSNDCTNFISQIMYAGGWPHYIDAGDPYGVHSWYYRPATFGITYSWRVAHDWGVFAQVLSHRTAPLDYVYQMLPTDVLQVDWDHPGEPGVDPSEPEGNIDHTMFVDGIDGTAGAATEVYLTYHSNDRWHVPFWGWLLPNQEPRDVWYAHRT